MTTLRFLPPSFDLPVEGELVTGSGAMADGVDASLDGVGFAEAVVVDPSGEVEDPTAVLEIELEEEGLLLLGVVLTEPGVDEPGLTVDASGVVETELGLAVDASGVVETE